MSPVRRGSPLGQLAAFARAEEREAAPAPAPLAPGSVDRFVAAAMAEIAREPGAPDASEADAVVADEPARRTREGVTESSDELARDERIVDGAPSSVDGEAIAAEAAVAPPPAKPAALPIAARPRGRVFAWATALALAACLALWLAPFGRTGALPPYAIALAGGVADTRGEPAPAIPDVAPALSLAYGARLVVTLRPATRVTGTVAARAFLVRGELRVPLALEATTSAEGAIRLTGVLADSLMPPGPAELVVLVGRDGEALADARRAESDAVRVLRRPVRIEVADR